MAVEMTLATAATQSEVRMARMNTSFSKNTKYQRSESPCGGKVRKFPALNDASTTTAIGASRNA